jgi:hypothetical protein
MDKKILVPAFIFFVAAFLFGCTYTSHTQIPVELLANDDSMGSRILTLVKCEHISTNGIETKVNGKHSDNQLLIEIMNPINLPNSQDSLDMLTLKIAQLIKPNLKNEDLFDTFKIMFVSKSTDGMTTTTKSTGHIWKKSEI